MSYAILRKNFLARLNIIKVIKLNACFYFKFPNRSKMSLASCVLGAPELENTPHNVNS